DGRPVGYAGFHANGRVSFPWCRPGHEAHAEPLFEAVLGAMRGRGLARAFAAYRGDWQAQGGFFVAHGFTRAREVVNFAVPLLNLPTPAARPSCPITPLRPEDVPAVLALGPETLRGSDPAALERQLFENPHFGKEALFALRGRASGAPVAVGLL